MNTRIFIGLLLIAATGCATKPANTKKNEAATNNFVALPVSQPGFNGAKVLTVNAKYQFVVLDYTGEVLPAIGKKVPIYRGTELVGEVRITEPIRIDFATADILEGDLHVGDEAR